MKTWLIIGSTAMYHWFPDSRKPKDIDILTKANIKSDSLKDCFIDTSWNDLSQLILDHNRDPVFLDADLLYTLKLSHAQWDIKWQKTMSDIIFLEDHDCEVNKEIHDELVKVWKKIHGPKNVNLNKPVDQFFNDAVYRKYNHELLHELVKFNDKPMHEYIRKDLNIALCDKELFDNLSYEKQYETCLEEILVTAIERSNLTIDSKNSEILIAVNNAIRLLSTSMTTGWFAEFLIFNYDNLFNIRREKWKKQLKKTLMNLR